MGRPRKPTAILEATGAFQKDPNRRRHGEPVPPDGPVIKPAFVKGRAAKIWNDVAPLCIAMGTLAACDARAFGKWCCLQAVFEEDAKKPIASLIAQARAYEEKFGIAGAGSRAKLGTDAKDKPSDPADEYFVANAGPGSTLRQ